MNEMEPIIDPKVIYLVDLISKITIASRVFVFLSGIGVAIAVFAVYDEKDKTYLKAALGVFLFAVALVILLPSKDVLYKMLVASYITPDNINIARDEIINLIREIAEEVKAIK